MRFLKSPAALPVGAAAGVLIGLFAPFLIPALTVISDVYMRLIQMCVLPMVACTVCVNINAVFSSVKGLLRRWLTGALLLFLLSAATGVTASVLMRSFITPDEKLINTLAQWQGGEFNNVLSSFIPITYYPSLNTTAPLQKNAFAPVIDFLTGMVPENIFNALSNGRTIQVVLFFGLLGVMMAQINALDVGSLKNACSGLYLALSRLVNRMLVLLPFAMCAMFATQFSSENSFQQISSLLGLIFVIWAALGCILIVSFLFIRYYTQCSLKDQWKAVKRTLMIALGTQSSLATVPVAAEDCPTHLGLDREVTDAILPVSITMCQSGVVACGAIASMFASLLYGVEITTASLTIIVLGSILYAISIIGAPGVIAVSMLSIILEALGIPSGIIVIIYLTIIPIIDPLCVFTGVYSNFAIASFVAGRRVKLH